MGTSTRASLLASGALGLALLSACATKPADPCEPVVVKNGGPGAASIPNNTSMPSSGNVGMIVKQRSADPACRKQ